MNFSDYINKSAPLHESESQDLHEAADKPSIVRVRNLTLEQFESAMATLCVLRGENGYSKPLAMKVTPKSIRFAWYDEDEDSYCISDYTAKYGTSDMPNEVDIPTLAQAKRML